MMMSLFPIITVVVGSVFSLTAWSKRLLMT